MIEHKGCIVFQGDSITDCGRTHADRLEWDKRIGSGYAKMTIDTIATMYPSHELSFYNRGINGAKVNDMLERWQTDCLDLKPTIVTILIGINDLWRQFDSGEMICFEHFGHELEKVLKQTKAIGSKIIVIEPFSLPCGVVTDGWKPILNKLQGIEKKLAIKYANKYISLNSIFARLCKGGKALSYTDDGVHPNEKGHRVIALEVLKAMEVFK